MREAPSILFDFLRSHETLMLRVYDDAAPKKVLQKGDEVHGTLTGGYGHTGPDLFIGKRVTRALAETWLASDVQEKAIKPLYKKVKASVIEGLNDHQYAALLAFVFNLGTGNKPWTIWKVLNAGKLDAVPAEMTRFNRMRLEKGGPLVVVKGLVNRRAAEVELWSTPTEKPAEAPATPTSAQVRCADTPPTPAHVDPKPLLAGAGAAITAAPAVVNQVRETLQPYADASEAIQKTIALLATIAAALAVASLVWMWIQRKRA